MAEFILSAQIPYAQSRYRVFQIETKYALTPLLHYAFVYLLLDQNHRQIKTPKSCVLDVARFLDLPQLNA